MTLNKHRIVEVSWIDAQSGFGRAEDVDELINNLQPLITHSIGYLLKKDNKGILLGFMMFDNMVKHFQFIPKEMVLEIKYLNRR